MMDESGFSSRAFRGAGLKKPVPAHTKQ